MNLADYLSKWINPGNWLRRVRQSVLSNAIWMAVILISGMLGSISFLPEGEKIWGLLIFAILIAYCLSKFYALYEHFSQHRPELLHSEQHLLAIKRIDQQVGDNVRGTMEVIAGESRQNLSLPAPRDQVQKVRTMLDQPVREIIGQTDESHTNV